MSIKDKLYNLSYKIEGAYARTKANILDFDFEKKMTLSAKIRWIFVVWFVALLYVSFAVIFLSFLMGMTLFKNHAFFFWEKVSNNVFLKRVNAFVPTFIFSADFFKKSFFPVIYAPIWEEVAFRWWFLNPKYRSNRPIIQRVVMWSCIVFGILHGGPLNIMIQGMVGNLLALLYLRNGRSYWSVVVCHGLYNLTVIVSAMKVTPNAIFALIL